MVEASESAPLIDSFVSGVSVPIPTLPLARYTSVPLVVQVSVAAPAITEPFQ